MKQLLHCTAVGLNDCHKFYRNSVFREKFKFTLWFFRQCFSASSTSKDFSMAKDIRVVVKEIVSEEFAQYISVHSSDQVFYPSGGCGPSASMSQLCC